eukprot:RCo048113
MLGGLSLRLCAFAAKKLCFYENAAIPCGAWLPAGSRRFTSCPLGTTVAWTKSSAEVSKKRNGLPYVRLDPELPSASSTQAQLHAFATRFTAELSSALAEAKAFRAEAQALQKECEEALSAVVGAEAVQVLLNSRPAVLNARRRVELTKLAQVETDLQELLKPLSSTQATGAGLEETVGLAAELTVTAAKAYAALQTAEGLAKLKRIVSKEGPTMQRLLLQILNHGGVLGNGV